MLPNKQVYLGDTDIPADDIRAAIAAVMNRDNEYLPHFGLYGISWMGSIIYWMHSNQFEITIYSDNWERKGDWGHFGAQVKSLDELPLNEWLVAIGDSPRPNESQHAVVAKGAKVSWDVHPSNDGLKGEPFEYWEITRKGYKK
jgi:hypothetical protein